MATLAWPLPEREPQSACQIVPLGREHLVGFHAALDEVARERRWLAMLQAPSFARTRRFVLESLRDGAIHYVAVADGRVVGWCDLRPKSAPTQRHSAVLGMGLVPGHRGQGLGSRLLATTLDRADGAGVRRAELVVRADNGVAIGLYRRFGFLEEGRCRQYLRVEGQDHDALIMARLLPERSREAP